MAKNLTYISVDDNFYLDPRASPIDL